MSNGWTEERRARQSAAIRNWKPWERSTGPRSHQGKARVSRNADKGGKRGVLRAKIAYLKAIMRELDLDELES
jgi:hypothetical protein